MSHSAHRTSESVVTGTLLRSRKRDYFLARSGGRNELVMEPFCWCGRALEQDYSCTECGHQCRVTLIACADPVALSIARELVRTNVDFRTFEVATLGA